jgi:OOP family OmpA-OmpF porin
VKKIALFAAAWLAAGTSTAQAPAPAAAASAVGPIVASGTVPTEAARASLLARLRQVFGPERVIDQLKVGPVAAPPNWSEYLNKLVGPSLKQVSHGELKLDGSSLSLRGDVPSEALRQQIGAELAGGLDPAYTVNNSLRVAASEQGLLDAALANRIIEFESGKAALTDSGRAILDQMSVALLKVKDKRVELIGHTDNAGARASNLALSQARAEAVKAYVVGKGVRAESVAVSGEGPDRPVADNRTPEGRARNRRIEFKVVQ